MQQHIYRKKQSNNGELLQTSNTDIAKEMTNYIQYQNAYKANIKPIQTISEMLGNGIDLKI
jgi:flagellar hook protein FlgE